MKREYTKTELGMTYGLLTGAGWWLSMLGAGLALGLGIGASMDRREG